MLTFARAAFAASLLAGATAALFFAPSVSAQTIPPGQTCGGLLCDAGIIGTKVPVGPDGRAPSQAQMAAAEAADPHHLPCHDFICGAFGKRDAEVPPPPPVAAAPVAEPEQPTKHVRKRKKIAKAETATRTPAPAQDAAPAK